MVRRKGVILIGVSLLLAGVLTVAGVYVFNRSSPKKATDSKIPIIDNAELRKPAQPIQDINSVKAAYDQKDYQLAVTRAKIIYDKEDAPIDFRLAALGYCVRSLKALGKDTAECQNRADALLEATSGKYQQFLLDTFNAKAAQ